MGKDLSFEKAVERLQSIVDELEQGEIGLDNSIKIFEEGLELVQTCNKKLQDAEGKLKKLINTDDGLQLSFFNSES